MPISAAAALGATLLLAGGGVATALALQQKPKKKKKGKKVKRPKVSLEGVFEKNAMLVNSPFVIEDAQIPIHLTTLDEPSYTAKYGGGYQTFDRVPLLKLEKNDVESLILGATSTIVNGQETPLAGKDVMRGLVTNLSADATRKAYELALAYVSTLGPVDWTDPMARDLTIAKILGSVAPGTDWSQGLRPYTWGDAPSLAWAGVQLLGALANQSYHNKVAMGGG